MADGVNLEAAAAGRAAARYKAMSPAKLPITRPAGLTIAPGFSPSALLESPVLLTNIKAEPSPTTGTFFIPSISNSSTNSIVLLSPRNGSNNSAHDKGTYRDFEFKPLSSSPSTACMSSFGSLVSPASHSSMTQQRNTPSQVHNVSQAEPLSHTQLVELEQAAVSPSELTLTTTSLDAPIDTVAQKANSHADMVCDGLEEVKGSENGIKVVHMDHNESSPSAIGEKAVEDGYNWRKYGQKHVKGSEFPRSYYKCTHPNCNVKKQLERSQNGHITDIVYKGRHEHPKPQPSRRLAVTAMLSSQGEEKFDGFPAMTSEDKASAHGHIANHGDSNIGLELSPVSPSDDDLENGGGQRNDACDEVAEDDDPESKRRRMDALGVDPNSVGKPNREPRVVVQTVSEVDILDDGYRWRKYGQKVVKGNPNPRSYYKCTSAGCPVRKHVERASHDPKAVITTYEGKHNHDVPTARNSSHEIVAPVRNENIHPHSGHMSLALSGISQSCDPRVFSHHFSQQAEENDAISLDLGLSPRSHRNAVGEKQHAVKPEQVQNHHNIQFATAECNRTMMQATSNLVLYGNSSIVYGSGDGKVDGFTFATPSINHSSNAYYSTPGNLVMGP